jgi:hypothetical protein
MSKILVDSWDSSKFSITYVHLDQIYLFFLYRVFFNSCWFCMVFLSEYFILLMAVGILTYTNIMTKYYQF